MIFKCEAKWENFWKICMACCEIEENRLPLCGDWSKVNVIVPVRFVHGSTKLKIQQISRKKSLVRCIIKGMPCDGACWVISIQKKFPMHANSFWAKVFYRNADCFLRNASIINGGTLCFVLFREGETIISIFSIWSLLFNFRLELWRQDGNRKNVLSGMEFSTSVTKNKIRQI